MRGESIDPDRMLADLSADLPADFYRRQALQKLLTQTSQQEDLSLL